MKHRTAFNSLFFIVVFSTMSFAQTYTQEVELTEFEDGNVIKSEVITPLPNFLTIVEGNKVQEASSGGDAIPVVVIPPGQKIKVGIGKNFIYWGKIPPALSGTAKINKTSTTQRRFHLIECWAEENVWADNQNFQRELVK